MSKRTSKWPITYVLILSYSEPQVCFRRVHGADPEGSLALTTPKAAVGEVDELLGRQMRQTTARFAALPVRSRESRSGVEKEKDVAVGTTN